MIITFSCLVKEVYDSWNAGVGYMEKISPTNKLFVVSNIIEKHPTDFYCEDVLAIRLCVARIHQKILNGALSSTDFVEIKTDCNYA